MSVVRQITRVSSGTLISAPLNLDYVGSKPISYCITGSSSGTFGATVEGTLDDVTQFSSAGTSSAASLFWFTMSSLITANSTIIFYQGPLAAIRVNSSDQSSSIVTLRVLQGVGW